MRTRLLLAPALALAGCGVTPSEEEQLAPPVPLLVNPSSKQLGLTQMPPCGAVLATFDNTAARSNGASTGTGYSCAGQGGLANGLQYQCVELVMRHFVRRWGLRWYGNARDLLRNAPQDRVDVRYNGDRAHPPVPGDLLVWEVGQWGHTALVTRVTATRVEVIEQNVIGDGRATFPYDGARIGPRWGNWPVRGWAHARANATPQIDLPATNVPALPPTASCHVGVVMGWTYCSAACPCGAGEGDCDTDAQCKAGLRCATDVGARYGTLATVDVCEALAPPATPSGQVSATCAGCDLSTHDCTGHHGTYACVPRSASCASPDGYLFRQCNCTGWQFCLPATGGGGRWSSVCETPAAVDLDCVR